jgi:hypothetical protein
MKQSRFSEEQIFAILDPRRPAAGDLDPLDDGVPDLANPGF